MQVGRATFAPQANSKQRQGNMIANGVSRENMDQRRETPNARPVSPELTL